MRLNELKESAEISITFRSKVREFSFPVKVLAVMEDELITTAIRFKEGVLVFDRANVSLDAWASDEDSRPIIWKNIECVKDTYDGKLAYRLSCKNEGNYVNRRGAFRVPLNIQGVAQVGMNRKADNVIVKDLSALGYSFTMKGMVQECIGKQVRLIFDDPQYKTHLTLLGTVVRIAPQTDDSYLVGCKLLRENDVISKYVAERQRRQ